MKEKLSFKNFDYQNCSLNELQAADPKELGKIVFSLAIKLSRAEDERDGLREELDY